MLTEIHTAVCRGMEGHGVTVQSCVSSGLPNFQIVGLAATTVMEAKERIRSAIEGSAYPYPRGRIVVNLAPANLRKNGSHLDLPIALGILSTQLMLKAEKAADYGVLGELSLDGKVVAVDGVLPMLLAMASNGLRKMLVPAGNLREGALVPGVEVIGVEHLEECVAIINGERAPAALPGSVEADRAVAASARSSSPGEDPRSRLDFADICGQEQAKRALAIAAAGRHDVLMTGSPGCGKTMLAKRLPGILPEMTARERMESTIIYSISGELDKRDGMVRERPFRMPHHSIGRAALLGGGNYPVPGEITLAHNGVLFLDEFCEFEQRLVESLRQPMEDKRIVHSRHGQAYEFPCRCFLVLAANPCPCGYLGDPERSCRCSPAQIARYRRRLSGPIMDRIDIHLPMERVSYDAMRGEASRGSSTQSLRELVCRTRAFAAAQGRGAEDARLPDDALRNACQLGEAEENLLSQAYRSLKLTPRTYYKTLRIARTIADMGESERVTTEHLAEALRYRPDVEE